MPNVYCIGVGNKTLFATRCWCAPNTDIWQILVNNRGCDRKHVSAVVYVWKFIKRLFCVRRWDGMRRNSVGDSISPKLGGLRETVCRARVQTCRIKHAQFITVPPFTQINWMWLPSRFFSCGLPTVFVSTSFSHMFRPFKTKLESYNQLNTLNIYHTNILLRY